MKIAIRGGHVPKFTGARKFIDELTDDRKVKNSVIKYLKQRYIMTMSIIHL